MSDEELIAWLRKADEYEPLGHDGWEAAARIAALTAQVAEARADLSGMVSEGRRMRAEYNIAVDQLAAAAARETESQTVRAEALKEAAALFNNWWVCAPDGSNITEDVQAAILALITEPQT